MKTRFVPSGKTYFVSGLLILFLLVAGTFIGLKVRINSQAGQLADEAALLFQKDRTEALLALIASNDHSLPEKNNAIWALGVLKDEKALPALESLLTGKECRHDSELCQYEIQKAIGKIKGDFRGSWQASSFNLLMKQQSRCIVKKATTGYEYSFLVRSLFRINPVFLFFHPDKSSPFGQFF